MTDPMLSVRILIVPLILSTVPGRAAALSPYCATVSRALAAATHQIDRLTTYAADPQHDPQIVSRATGLVLGVQWNAEPLAIYIQAGCSQDVMPPNDYQMATFLRIVAELGAQMTEEGVPP